MLNVEVKDVMEIYLMYFNCFSPPTFRLHPWRR
jgi:hypothetical protein